MTNQRFYRVSDGALIDETWMFHREKKIMTNEQYREKCEDIQPQTKEEA